MPKIIKKESDSVAEKEIIDYLKRKKEDKRFKISIINLVSDLNLPAEQIERIMDKLEGETI